MDREKVIEALHCRAYDDDLPCSICAYYRPDEKPVAKCDYRGLMDDAIALLEEQEAELQKGRYYSEVFDIGYKAGKESIVRCRDCKECYFASNRIQSEQTFACGKHGIDVTPDFFCADGEREGR